MLFEICAVAAGGAIGAAGRYCMGALAAPLSAAMHIPSDFPLATFAVNFIGCFVIGALSVLFDSGPWQGRHLWRLFA
ncbi:MAG: CrcB family protein, partial [Slackia sp.]|nr:CrcB family protein [Slackia sp.]